MVSLGVCSTGWRRQCTRCSPLTRLLSCSCGSATSSRCVWCFTYGVTVRTNVTHSYLAAARATRRVDTGPHGCAPCLPWPVLGHPCWSTWQPKPGWPGGWRSLRAALLLQQNKATETGDLLIPNGASAIEAMRWAAGMAPCSQSSAKFERRLVYVAMSRYLAVPDSHRRLYILLCAGTRSPRTWCSTKRNWSRHRWCVRHHPRLPRWCRRP